MDLPDKTSRKGQLLEPVQSIVHGCYVVHNLLDVSLDTGFGRFGLKFDQVDELCLCALDLAGQHRFFANIHVDEQIRVGENCCGPVQTTKGPIGLRQQRPHFIIHEDWWDGREARRDESAVSLRLQYVSACSERIVNIHHLPPPSQYHPGVIIIGNGHFSIIRESTVIVGDNMERKSMSYYRKLALFDNNEKFALEHEIIMV